MSTSKKKSATYERLMRDLVERKSNNASNKKYTNLPENISNTSSKSTNADALLSNKNRQNNRGTVTTALGSAKKSEPTTMLGTGKKSEATMYSGKNNKYNQKKGKNNNKSSEIDYLKDRAERLINYNEAWNKTLEEKKNQQRVLSTYSMQRSNPAPWRKDSASTTLKKGLDLYNQQKEEEKKPATFQDWSMANNLLTPESQLNQWISTRPQKEQEYWGSVRNDLDKQRKMTQEQNADALLKKESTGSRIQGKNANRNALTADAAAVAQKNQGQTAGALTKTGTTGISPSRMTWAQQQLKKDPGYQITTEKETAMNPDISGLSKDAKAYVQFVQNAINKGESIENITEMIRQLTTDTMNFNDPAKAYVEASPYINAMIREYTGADTPQEHTYQTLTRPMNEQMALEKMADPISRINRQYREYNQREKEKLNAATGYAAAQSILENAEGNLGSWMSGTTPEYRLAMNQKNAQAILQATEKARLAGVGNTTGDIETMNQEGRANKRFALTYQNKDLEKQIEELQKQKEAMEEEFHQLNVLTNDITAGPTDIVYYYGDKYNEKFEKYLKENNIEVSENDRDRVFAQFIIDESNREKEALNNKLLHAEATLEGNNNTIDELDRLDEMDNMRQAIMDPNARAAKKKQLEAEISDLQAKIDENEARSVPFAEKDLERKKLKKELSKKQEQMDLLNNFTMLDDDIEDDAAFHPEYDQKTVRTAEWYRKHEGNEYNTTVDGIYSYINGGSEYEYWKSRSGNGFISNEYRNAMAMLPEEKEQFNKLYNDAIKNGREPVEAQAFLDALQPYLNQRLRTFEELSTRSTARRLPGLSSVASAMASMTYPIKAAETMYGRATGADWVEDPYNNFFASARMQSDIENQVAEDLGETGGFFYKAGMSAVKNFLRSLPFAGAGALAGSIGTLSEFFGEAYYTGYQQKLEETGDPDKAGVYAFVDASISTFFEVASVEKMFSDPSDLLTYLLQVGGAEMSEEFFEGVFSPYIHELLDGSNEWKDNAKQIIRDGGYEDENGNWIEITEDNANLAYQKALKDYNNQVAESVLSAGISTLGPAGFGIVRNNVRDNNFTKDLGKTVLNKNINKQMGRNEKLNQQFGNFMKLNELAQKMKKGSEAKEIADEIEQDARNGKNISFKKTGKLVRAIMGETNEEIGQFAKDVLGGTLKQKLISEGMKEEDAEKYSTVLQESVIRGEMTPQAMLILSTNEQAMGLWKEINQSEDVQTARKIQKSVMDLIVTPEERKTASIRENVAARMAVAKYATEQDEELKEALAAGEKRTGSALEVVANGKITEVSGFGIRENTNKDGIKSWTVTVKLANGEEVDINHVKSTNENAAKVMQIMQDENGQSIGQNAAVALMEIGQKTKDIAGAMTDTINIMYGKLFGTKADVTTLNKEQESMVEEAVDKDNAEADAEASQNRKELKPGQGVITYNGKTYGTTEFSDELNKLDKTTRDEANYVAQLMKSIGMDVDFYYDNSEKGSAQQGMFVGAKGIRINLAGTFTKDGTHRSVVATAAHEATHWLRANAAGAYRTLQQFSMKKLQENGTDLQAELKRIMDNYKMYGEHLTLDKAAEEMVAMGCEQIFTNEKLVNELQAEDPRLYGKVRQAVRTVLNKMRAAITGNNRLTSSRYAVNMQNTLDQLGAVWKIAYEAAKGAEGTGENSGVMNSKRMDTEEHRKQTINIKAALKNPARYNDYFTYEKLTAKEPIQAIILKPVDNSKTRKEIIDTGMENARKNGKKADGQIYVHVYDTGTDVRVTRQGLQHGFFDKEKDQTIIERIGEILKESVLINTADNRKDTHLGHYKLLGAAVNSDGKGITYVSFSVNKLTNAVEDVSTLYSVKAYDDTYKKKAAGEKPIDLGNSLTIPTFPVSIAKALEAVKDEFTDILPINVLQKLGINERPQTKDEARLHHAFRMDDEYQTAVDNGNMAAAQKMVDQAAKAAGYTEKVYHGTNEFGFTQFDTGLSDGFIFTSYLLDMAGSYTEKDEATVKNISDRVMLNKPATYMEGDELLENFNKYVKDLDGDKIISIDFNKETGLYDVLLDTANPFDRTSKTKVELMEQDLQHYLAKAAEESVSNVYQLYAKPGKQLVIEGNGSSWDEIEVDIPREELEQYAESDYDIGTSENGKTTTKTRIIAAWAKDNGYDSVKIREIWDYGGYGHEHAGFGSVGIFFNPNDVKSADAVTYDDEGNVIPPSERFKEEKNDIRFSMQMPVEERADGLIAVHNLNAEQLMKTLKLGGFAMPSIAIIKNDYAHNRYGDISVVFYPGTIDPKASEYNKVYGGDAWTPTYPGIEYKINTKELEKIYNKIKSLIPEGIKGSQGMLELYEDNFTQSVNGHRGDVISATERNMALQMAYLKDKGINIEYPMKAEPLARSSRFSNEQIIRVAEELGEDLVREAYNGGYEYFDEHPEVKERILKALNDQWKEQHKDVALKIAKMDLYTADKFGFGYLDSILQGAFKYFNNGISQEIDEYALRDKLEEAIDKEDFAQWRRDLFKNVIEKSGLRNNKDLFTNSGNRRSWDALHDPETLENVVRIMRSEADKGANTFFSQSEMLALGTRDFRSIDDIRKHKDQLKHISDEEMSEAKTNIVNGFSELMDEMYDRSEPNIFIARDRALQAMVEAVRNSRSAAGIMRELRQWHGLNITEDMGERIAALLEEVANLPTEYFEAKPQRAVGFDEIAKVILPQGTSKELLDALEEQGIEYETYDGTDEDRLRALNEQKNAMFSFRDDTDYDVRAWMETVPEWSLRTEAEKELLRKYGSLRRKSQMDQLRMEKIDAEIKRLEGMQGKTETSEGTPVRTVTVDDVLRANGIVQDGAMLKKNGVIIGSLKLGVLNIYDKYKDIRKTLENSGAFEYDEKTASWTAAPQNIHADQERDIRRQLEALQIRKQNLQKVMDQTNDQLAEITGSEGFGGMMYRQQKVLNDLVYNKTQAEVQDSVEKMTQAAERIRQTIEENKAKAAELEKSDVVNQFRKLLGTTTAEQTARELKKEYSSTWTAKQIQEYLNPIILKIKTGEDFKQDIETLAGILVNSDSRNTYEELEALRGLTITLGKGAQAELKAQNSSLKEVRARLAGTGITVKYGERSTLEADIEDLRAEYPMIPELGDEKDALNNFLNWIDSMKSVSAAGEFYDQRLAEAMAVITGKAAGAARGIYMPNDPKAQKQVLAMMEFVKGLNAETQQAQDALQQVADEMEAMQKAGREASGKTAVLMRDVNVALDYYNRISRIAVDEAKQKRTEATIEQLKSEQAQKIIKNNEEWRQLIQRDADARKQLEENRKAQAQINTSLKRMYNLLQNPKGTKNIPEYMQGLAREVLGIFAKNDNDGGRRFLNATRDGLQNMLRVLNAWEAQDGPFNPADLSAAEEAVTINLLQDLDIIRDGIKAINTPVNGKNKLDTLQQRGITMKNIQEAVSEIYSAIQAEQEVQIGNRRVAVEDAAYKVAAATQGKNYREWTGKLGGTIRTLHKAIVSGNMTPEYFFRTIGNEGLSDLWDTYHWAENRNGLELAKAKARLEEIAKQHKFDTWDMGQTIKLQLESGETEVTLGQLMSLWATWKREKTLGPQMSEHLTKGGFYAEKDLRDGILGRTTMERKAHRVTEEDMAKVKDLLTEEQRKFVDDVVLFMSRDMSELGNAASMAAYGIRMYKEKYYFPFQMWDGVKSRKSNDAGSAAGANDRAFHPSFSKTRVHGANNALVLGDFMQTATDHIAGMINYATMGLANESMQKVLNQQTAQGPYETMRNTRAILEEAYGREAMQYLTELQNQLNGGAVRTTRSPGDRLISLFRKNAVAGSLSVALQQPLSYIRAAMMINPKFLTTALMKEYWKGSYDELMKHSGVAVIKDMGRFDMNAGQSAREYLMPDGKKGKLKQVWDKAAEYATILPEKMDAWTWTRMWVAVKAEQKALHPEMDVKSEEFLDMCGVRFNGLMRRTQVYDSVLVRSENMRSDDYWMKGLTSFMAEPTLTLNVLADAVRSAKQGEKGGKMMLAKAGATFVVSAVMQSVIKALFSSGRTPDEKKTWLENFLYRFTGNIISEGNPLTLIPGYSDLVTLLKDGKLEDDAMGAVGKIITAYSKTKDLLFNGGSKGLYRDIEDSAAQLAQIFTNIPAKNIMRDLRAMYNWFLNDTAYAKRGTSMNVIKNQTMEALINADNMLSIALQNAGVKTDNKAYYKRILEAEKEGNEQEKQDLIDYLLNGKGMKNEKTIMNGVAGVIRDEYKGGKLERSKAEELLKITKPTTKDKDITETLDKIDYEKKTGETVDSYSNYTPLYDAMDAEDDQGIKEAKEYLVSIGYKESDIISTMKSHVKGQYKDGEITREEAEALYKKYDPNVKTKDIADALDEIDYEKRTGETVDSYSNYTPLQDAIDRNSTKDANEQIAYLKTIGYEEKDINSSIVSYIKTQYKEGEITRTEAEQKLKTFRKDMSKDDIWWEMDRVEYSKETGESVSGNSKYYRLKDAISTGKSNDIRNAVNALKSHGVNEKDIKSWIGNKSTGFKTAYLNATGSEKIRIKNALIMAYKAVGLSETEANELINKWK